MTHHVLARAGILLLFHGLGTALASPPAKPAPAPTTRPGATQPSQPKLPAPGDCTAEKHRELQVLVDFACKTVKLKCNIAMSCDEMALHWAHAGACADARRWINDLCFRGGDEDHLREHAIAVDHVRQCEHMMKKKKCPPPCPEENPCDAHPSR